MTQDNATEAETATVTSSNLGITPQALGRVGASLRLLLADCFTLYLKTKNFHWHMQGSHFREYHLMLDEQGEQLFDATDGIAERARKIGEATLRSIGEISKYQRLKDSDASSVPALVMLQELCTDNKMLASFMRETHAICDEAGDLATASLLENWIDEAERRSWFLSATIDSA